MNQSAFAASAALRRTNVTTHGYMLELGLANTGTQPIIGWDAEVTMPSGASVESAPGHEVLVVPVVPDVWTVSPARANTLTPGRRGIVQVAVRCTRDAPIAVQFTAQAPTAKVFAKVDVVAVRSEDHTVLSDGLTWPGSTALDRGQSGHLRMSPDPADSASQPEEGAGLQRSVHELAARVATLEGASLALRTDTTQAADTAHAGAWSDWLGEAPRGERHGALHDGACDRLDATAQHHDAHSTDVNAIAAQLTVANTLLSRIAAELARRPHLDAPASIQVDTTSDEWWYVRWDPVVGATHYQYQHPYGAGTTLDPETPTFPIPPGGSRTCVFRALRGTRDASPWVSVRIDLDNHGRLRQMVTAEVAEPLELRSD